MGATLTLNRAEGNLLIAFTAVFVGIVTERFWRIACIIFYRFHSSPKPHDGLYYQQQAVLRNSSSTVSAIWTLTQLILAWQNVAKCSFVRVLPALLTAVFCLGAFTVAGGFSSSISSGISDEVLLNGTNCGIIHFTTLDKDAARIFVSYSSQIVHSAGNYAQQCYSPDSPGISDSAGISDCKYFIKDHLFSMVDNQAVCPFHDSICRSNNSNIRLDTGYLSLLNDLGSNAPPDQDILFRAVLHCAPLETQNYRETVTLATENFISYHYWSYSSGLNYIYMAETLDSQYKKKAENTFRGQGNSFILYARSSLVYKGKSDESKSQLGTIPALFNPDADTTLIFLSGNGIEFFERTNDPWYHATVPGDNISSPDVNGGYFTVYRPDEAASPMGCTSQFQFCNPSLSSNKCGPLASQIDAQIESAPLFGMTAADFEKMGELNGTMISRYQWLNKIIDDAVVSTGSIVNSLGPDSLDSLKYFSNGFMGSLPDEQWQLDVKHWWAIFLASLQAGLVETARGPVDPTLDGYKWLPDSSDIRAMCNNQKIRSTRHVSFSLFGLYFTLVTGLLIITTSFIMEPIFKCLYQRRKYQEYTYLEWAASETLQLQRIGFQGINAGTWSGCTDSVPRTEPGEILTSLAVEYSSNNESNVGTGRTSNKANGDQTAASNSANRDLQADAVSLDDLLDASTYPNSDSLVVQDAADRNSEQTDPTSQTSQY